MQQKAVPPLSFSILTSLFDVLADCTGYGKKLKSMTLELLELKPSEELLDIGCGTGTLLILAKNKFPHIEMTGIEPDSKSLEIAISKAKKNNLDINFVSSGVEKLPFSIFSFDVIVSTLAFHHIPNNFKKRGLKEIHRVLKSDGRFLLVDFGKTKGFWYHLADKVLETLRIPEATTMQDNSLGRIPQLLEEAGFVVKEVHPRYKGVDFLLCTKK